jgi:hypothetical protein
MATNHQVYMATGCKSYSGRKKTHLVAMKTKHFLVAMKTTFSKFV